MRKQALFSGILNASTIALGFLVSVLLARMLGASGYGAYSLVVAIFSILSIFTQVGIPKLTMRETARALENEEWQRMRSLWRWAVLRIALLSVSVSFFVIGIGFLAPVAWLSEHRRLLALGALIVPLASLGALRGAILRGLGHVILGQLPEAGLRNLLLLTLLVGISFTIIPSTPLIALSATVVATLLAFIFGAWLLFIKTPQQLRAVPNTSSVDKTWIRAAALMGFSAGLTQINNYADLFILGSFKEPEEVGIYRIVYQVSTLVIFGLQAVSLIVAPRLARAHASGDKAKLQELVQFSSRVAVLVATPLALILFIWGKTLLTLIFGTEFEVGYSALVILVLAQLVNASFGAIGVLMNMTRNEKFLARALGIASAANVILNIILIPFFGIIGAATATVISIAIWNTLLFVVAKRKIGITCHPFTLKRKKDE